MNFVENNEPDKELPCRDIHRIDGYIPQSEDLHLDGRVCDCGRMTYRKEYCGCPNNGGYQLRSDINPNYQG